MKIIVGCEESQEVTIALRNKGHEAYSCDILLCSGGHPEWHIRGDIYNYLNLGWDMGLFFTPCTYSCNSGIRWLIKDGKINQERYKQLEYYAGMLRDCLNSNIPRVACENPIPHRFALKIIGRKYDQIIQPWQFGHGETKATCLWLKNLPLLKPTLKVNGRIPRIHHIPPSPDRGIIRAKTYRGIAEAMATQWGNLTPELLLTPCPSPLAQSRG